MGLIAGVVGAVLLALVIAIASQPVNTFWRWWRPYPPACENGTCVSPRDYRPSEIPEDVVRRVRGLSRFGNRCRCGNVYAGGCDYPLLNRWVRVLPDGEVRPYLMHRVFGKWKLDETTVVSKAAESKAIGPPIELPGWTIPLASTILCGGIALAIAYFGPEAKAHPIRPWFVMGCTVFGLAVGSAVWWMRGSAKR